MAVKCPEGHLNSDGSAFCNQCGKPIPGAADAGSDNIEPARDSATEADAPPAEAKPQTRWKIYAIVAGVAVILITVAVILAITITGAVTSAQEEAAATAAESARLNLLSDAVGGCLLSPSVVQDEGRSAFLDNSGDDFGSGDLTIAQVFCVLDGLDTPDAVINHMSQTRSLDGTQSDTWNDFSATWTYHPDNGLDIIIKLTDG